MYNGYLLSELITYAVKEYPDYDIRKSKKKFRQRLYEQLAMNEVLEYCMDRPFDDLVDVLEQYEILYSITHEAFKSDAYKFQLNVVRKLLIFLRKRSEIYGF